MHRSRSRSAAAATLATITLCACSSPTDGNAVTDAARSGSGTSAPSGSTTTGASPTPRSDSTAFADPSAVATLLGDARRDFQAVTTYDYRRLADYRRVALDASTGAFRQTLEAAIDNQVAPNAPKRRAVQAAVVDVVGVSALADDQAEVLVFGQLRTISRDTGSTGRLDPTAEVVQLARADGSWKIAKVLTGVGTVVTPPPAQLPGNAALQAAYSAAIAQAVRLNTFHRATFAAEYDRALAGTTGQLHTSLAARRDSVLAALTKGGFDVGAGTGAAAVVSCGSGRVEVAVVVTTHEVRNSKRGSDRATSVVITMEHVGGRWLAGQYGEV